MSTSVAANSAPHKNSRRTFYLAATAFFAPLAVAFLIYYGTDWRPVRSTSHGDLITPARPLPEASLAMPEGKTTVPGFLKDKWSMVYIDHGTCDMECRHALADMRQVRLALGKEMARVQRIFLYTGSCCDEQYFSAEQAGLIRANIDSAEGAALLAVFPSDGTPAVNARRIYFVDPLGNLMMSYPPQAAAKGVLTDLKKLLGLSHIG